MVSHRYVRPHFTYSFVSGPLGYSHLFRVVKNGAMNVVCKYLFKSLLSVLLGICPDRELLNYIQILLSVLGKRHTACYSACAILRAHRQCTGVRFLHVPANTYFLFLCFLFFLLVAIPNGCDICSISLWFCSASL